MPRGDGTGPMGAGPMTGRGAGYCGGFSVPGYMNRFPGAGRAGFGYGRGFGRRRGGCAYPYGAGYYGMPYGNPYGQQTAPGREADMLKEQARAMQEELKAVNERIAELESAGKQAE